MPIVFQSHGPGAVQKNCHPILGQVFRSQPARLMPNGRGKMNLKAYDFYNSLLVEFQGQMG